MIKLVNKEYIKGQSYEAEIIQGINRKNIFALMTKNGFNPENLLYIKKFSTKMIRKFNACLRKVNKKSEIKIYEILLLLDNEYSTIDIMVSMLDENNRQIVRNECTIAYNINDNDCTLFDFLSY